jgi:hypothetical protein
VFAYQARPRVCFRDDGRELVFPNEVRIDIVFSPGNRARGMALPGRTGAMKSAAQRSSPAGVRLAWGKVSRLQA